MTAVQSGGPLPARHPEMTSETAPFWSAAAEGHLLLLRCDACRSLVWYPRGFCPDCGSRSLSWEQAAGTGSVYSFTVTRRGQGAWRDAGPYVLAYVELDEGPRVMTNIVECDVDAVHVGQRVEVVFADTGEGTALPRFKPTLAVRSVDEGPGS